MATSKVAPKHTHRHKVEFCVSCHLESHPSAQLPSQFQKVIYQSYHRHTRIKHTTGAELKYLMILAHSLFIAALSSFNTQGPQKIYIYDSKEEARKGRIASLISLSGPRRFVELIAVYHITQKD